MLAQHAAHFGFMHIDAVEQQEQRVKIMYDQVVDLATEPFTEIGFRQRRFGAFIQELANILLYLRFVFHSYNLTFSMPIPNKA